MTTKTGKAPAQGKTTAKTTKASSKKGPSAGTRQRGQMVPTADRYREIQAALVQKGYLTGEPTGVWDNDSVEAMKRFQTDKNLPPTGKITSAALIGLGLGPKPADSADGILAPPGASSVPTPGAPPVSTRDETSPNPPPASPPEP